MGFWKKEMSKLTHIDMLKATHWKKQFIKSNHPIWSDHQVDKDYERLSLCKIVAIDEWARKFLDDENATL